MNASAPAAASGGGRETQLRIVTWQIGREPREPWRVSRWCSWGFPATIASPPLLEDGTPFPTTFWLTCPWLLDAVAKAESSGAVAEWAARLERDAEIAERMREADTAYREARAAEAAEGEDPCADVGIAGQRDSLATKCLHAHVAAFLNGTGDPVGDEIVSEAGRDCPDARCRAALEEQPHQKEKLE